MDMQPSVDTEEVEVADPVLTRLAELRLIWQGTGGGFRTTPEALAAIDAEIEIRCSLGDDDDELDRVLSERKDVAYHVMIGETERRRPIKERLYAAIAGWGGLDTIEMERLYPEVDTLRMDGALHVLERERRIRSTRRPGDWFYTVTGPADCDAAA